MRHSSIRIDRCRYHRNGCHLEGFCVVEFRERDGRKFVPRIGIVSDANVAVIDPVNPLNRFRGDYYEERLREAVKLGDADGSNYDQEGTTN